MYHESIQSEGCYVQKDKRAQYPFNTSTRLEHTTWRKFRRLIPSSNRYHTLINFLRSATSNSIDLNVQLTFPGAFWQPLNFYSFLSTIPIGCQFALNTNFNCLIICQFWLPCPSPQFNLPFQNSIARNQHSPIPKNPKVLLINNPLSASQRYTQETLLFPFLCHKKWIGRPYQELQAWTHSSLQGGQTMLI